MPDQLQFMDCPNCSKRVATTAPVCRHCGKSPKPHRPTSGYMNQEEASGESHMALEHSGYDESEDDFDYQQFVAEEFGDAADTKPRRKPWWWYTAWLMIIVFSLPILLQIMSLFR